MNFTVKNLKLMNFTADQKSQEKTFVGVGLKELGILKKQQTE